MCALCSQSIETISHLFIECEWSKQVWFGSCLRITFQYFDENKISFTTWIPSITQTESEEIVQHVMVICYEIWLTRNKNIF